MPEEFAPISTYRPSVLGTRYMVASGHYLASAAAVRMLERGGNVVDAGVAAGLCINVVQPDMTNLGGVAPIILHQVRTRETVTISGLGWWPRAATIEELRRREAATFRGILTSVMPAALDAWVEALDRYGTMPFAEVAAPATELAERGFPVNRHLAANIAQHAQQIGAWPSSRQIFLGRGRPPRVGERLVQADLARTLRRLVDAERGAPGRHEGLERVRDLFYRGDVARAMAAFSQEQGGFVTAEDLAGFRARLEPACSTTYRGHDVYACGPWCQGPVVLQALNVLEGYDIASMPRNTGPVLHLIVEALKAAFADRHAYYGDPQFVRVPMTGLLSKAYAAEWRARIDVDAACPGLPEAGDAWRYEPGGVETGRAPRPVPARGPAPPDTSYLCVVDADGNAFSATPSDPVFGAPVVPGLGLIISPRGSQSWEDVRHPSCLAPGKRPRLTPNPGLVMRDGHVVMAYGTPGLDVQPQAMVQFLLNVLDYGLDVQQAIEAPRLATYSFPLSSHPHAYEPGKLCVEGRVPADVPQDLARRGHRVTGWPDWTPQAGSLCGVVRDRGEGVLAGGADPRRLSYAIGW